jgi:hypothetical protein
MNANLETQIIQLLATTCELAPDQLEAGLTIEGWAWTRWMY